MQPRILHVGEEPPPMHSGMEREQRHARGNAIRPKGNGKAGNSKAVGRFQVLNAFVDLTLSGLSRGEIAAWLVLYRDCRDDIAQTSLSDIARRGGMGRRTAIRAIQRLEAVGLVQRAHRGGLNRGPSAYRLRAVPSDS